MATATSAAAPRTHRATNRACRARLRPTAGAEGSDGSGPVAGADGAGAARVTGAGRAGGVSEVGPVGGVTEVGLVAGVNDVGPVGGPAAGPAGRPRARRAGVLPSPGGAGRAAAPPVPAARAPHRPAPLPPP